VVRDANKGALEGREGGTEGKDMEAAAKGKGTDGGSGVTSIFDCISSVHLSPAADISVAWRSSLTILGFSMSGAASCATTTVPAVSSLTIPEVSVFLFSDSFSSNLTSCTSCLTSALFSHCGNNSSLSPGRKVSILPQVTPHSGVGCPASVKNNPFPLVSITSNIFFRDSGSASAKMSVLAVAQNWPTKSNIVSHSALNVGKLDKGASR